MAFMKSPGRTVGGRGCLPRRLRRATRTRYRHIAEDPDGKARPMKTSTKIAVAFAALAGIALTGIAGATVAAQAGSLWHGRDGGPAHESGSASCRARVCQYG